MASARTSLIGIGVRASWAYPVDAQGLAHPGRYCEDDYRVEPASGLAVVASGNGAIGAQGRPGAVLAAWSIVGEVQARAAASAEERLMAGFRRAHAATERLTWSWRAAMRPAVSAAALLLDGDRAWIGHVGTTRVSRLTAQGLEPITRAHTLARELAEGQYGHLAGQTGQMDMTRIVTRSLGVGEAEPELTAIAVQPGDWFLIACDRVHRLLADVEIAEVLRDEGTAPDGRAFALLDALHAAERPCSSVGLAIVGVGEGGEVRAAHGGTRRPATGWLFNPGAELDPPPPAWLPEIGAPGPSPRWFEEIAGPLCAL